MKRICDLDKNILDKASVEMARVISVVPPDRLRELGAYIHKNLDKDIAADIFKLASYADEAVEKIKTLT